MKLIHKFQAEDGTLFNEVEQCREYEQFMIDLDIAMSVLHSVPVLEGENFYEHPKGSVREARDDVIDLVTKQLGIPDHARVGAIQVDHNQTIFGRYVDDSGNRAAHSAWSRFMAMSVETDREYSQPYFMIKMEGR